MLSNHDGMLCRQLPGNMPWTSDWLHSACCQPRHVLGRSVPDVRTTSDSLVIPLSFTQRLGADRHACPVSESAGSPGSVKCVAGQTRWTAQLLQSIRDEGLLRWIARQAAKRPIGILLAAYVFGTDWLIAWHGLGFTLRGIIDEPAHLATAVVVLGAITRFCGSLPGPKFGWTMLACSVLIDLDHLPAEFGSMALTNGTPRPYTHALWTVIVLALAWAVARRLTIRSGRPRPATAELILAGAAWGIAAHFLRDIATAPMSFWWPVRDSAVQVPYWWYVAALLAIIVFPPVRRWKGVAGQSPSGDTIALPEKEEQPTSTA